MASEPNVNVSDSVVMGSIINLKEIHNLIIKIDSSELGAQINNLLNHKKDNENNFNEVKLSVKTEIESFKQNQKHKTLPFGLIHSLFNSSEELINDNFLQRIVCQDLHEFYWNLYYNLMVLNGSTAYSDYVEVQGKEILNETINCSKILSLTALKMNESPFAVLCKIRSMGVLSMISAFAGEMELAEKYGLECLNKWENYGDLFFKKCGYFNQIMDVVDLDYYLEYQMVYGSYPQLLLFQPQSEKRLEKFLNLFEIHPESGFKWSIEPSSPLWLTVYGLPEFSILSDWRKKQIYQKWLQLAEQLSIESSQHLLFYEEFNLGLE